MPRRLWRIRNLIKLTAGLWIASVRLAWRSATLLARLDVARARAARAVSRRGSSGAGGALSSRWTPRSLGAPLLSVLTGAGAMYFFDPAEGRNRRARALERSQRLVRRSSHVPAGVVGNGHAVAAGTYTDPSHQLSSAPRPGGPASAPWGAPHEPAIEPENGHGSA
jgi:hypothetical protein